MTVAILYSGGLDSRILRHMAQLENLPVVPFYVDHGQNAAASELSRLPRDAVIRKLEWLDVQNGLYDKGDLGGPIYIPARNLVFATLAAAMLLPTEIWIGALFEEVHPGATDKNVEFMRHTEATLNYVLSPFIKQPIKMRAPLFERGLTRVTSLAWALSNGLSVDEILATTSCYHQDEKLLSPCGNCKQCLRRAATFWAHQETGLFDRELATYRAHPLFAPTSRNWFLDALRFLEQKGWTGPEVHDMPYFPFKNVAAWIERDFSTDAELAAAARTIRARCV